MYSFGYIINSQICLLVLYLIYIVVLNRKIGFAAARGYLLGLIPVSLLLPLIVIPILPPTNYDNILASTGSIQELGEITTSQAKIPTIDWMLALYLAGMIGLVAIIGFRMVVNFKIIRSSRSETIAGRPILFSPYCNGAFSLAGKVVISEKYRTCSQLDQIISHEQSHIRLHHTADLALINILRTLLWFNPAVWHIETLLREVHEYQADSEVLKQGFDPSQYATTIIDAQMGIIQPFMASSLNYKSTKNRIKMLVNHNTPKGSTRLLFAIPALGILMSAFCLTSAQAEATAPLTADSSKTQSSVTTVTLSDSLNTKGKTIHVSNTTGSNVTVTAVGVNKGTHQVETVVTSEGDKKTNLTLRTKDGSTPLIILDGKEIESPSAVAPETIGSVTILKNNEATEKYGEKGINGVIIITSKPSFNITLNKDGEEKSVSISSESLTINQQSSVKTTGTVSNISITTNGESNTSPLIILDGKKLSKKEASKLDIDKEKIVGITVLKGEQAIKQYGDKGKEGVLIITTKK